MISAVSPYEELIAYETLWARQSSTLAKIATFLKNVSIPSKASFDLSDMTKKEEVEGFFSQIPKDFSVITAESAQYPQSLKDPKHQIKLFYYKGDLGLLEAEKRISIVGARKTSEEGRRRAAKIARLLVKQGYVIVSGLAAGIDTSAMEATIDVGGKVIGVIGTPINQYYPKENKSLQDEIANKHLLISHVPIYKYSKEPFNSKKFYFPQRNTVMAAISDATIIVEASDTSGSLTQARACINMGRKLFILDSCFENSSITWPKKYLEHGAIRVKSIKDIVDNL
ncbi:DNA-processing protein DprA [Sulfurimonas sp.]|uniref:DNA-processing protein DprA n=1 Tax=Sulfurimonas sp. TaxID=2022749 RepID=UPI00356343E3